MHDDCNNKTTKSLEVTRGSSSLCMALETHDRKIKAMNSTSAIHKKCQ